MLLKKKTNSEISTIALAESALLQNAISAGREEHNQFPS